MKTKTSRDGNLDLNFFTGFAWPVPAAFSGAVSAFRFEPGDVLYRDASGYGTPRRKPRTGSRAIQVLERPPSSGTAAGAGEGDPRRTNWESRVRVAVLDLAAGTREVRELTQGDLFMTIWRGEEARLEGGGEACAMPLSARDLGQSLPSARDALLAKAGGGSTKRAEAKVGSRFFFVVDQSSDASRAKAATIEEGLEAAGAVERIDLTPAEAGVPDGENYHPALLIRCLTLPGQEPDAVTAILRQRLYGGDSDVESGDRFSLGRHGLLEALGADTSD